MQMRLRPVNVHPVLRGSIEKIWIFESNGRVPDEDMKLVVPNGRVKLVIPFRNNFLREINGVQSFSKEHQINFVGLSDIPSKIDFERDAVSGTIGVEFTNSGAYRFFRLRQSEVKNQMHSITDILGKRAKDIEQQVADAETPDKKVQRLQQFLLTLFYRQTEDTIVEYCVQRIRQTNGGITVRRLEQETGYSSRWLTMKFDEKVGVSPKNLSAITRFIFVYDTFTNNRNTVLLNKLFYELYYDQSHFIREFKRFTGIAPTKLERKINEFGKIFYKH